MSITHFWELGKAKHWRMGAAGLTLIGGLMAVPAVAQPGTSLAAYRCDENGGATVFDFSGNGNNGANAGVTYTPDTPLFAPGNYALEFNHGQDAVTIPAGPGTNLNSYTALTLEAHIKLTTTNGLHYILWADDGPFSLHINNNLLFFSLQGSSGSASRSAAFTSVNVWTHVAGTWDGTTSVLYINGAPVATGAAAVGTVTVSPVRNIIRIGNDETATSVGFNRDLRGLADEVRIVNRALSAAEVAFDAAHSFSAVTLMPCSTISAGGAAGAAGGFIGNAGQVVIGRSTNPTRSVHAGLIPCLVLGVPGLGDCDPDGDVDYFDLDKFVGCMTGPDGGPVEPDCECSDFDGDTDTDLADYAEFELVFTGP